MLRNIEMLNSHAYPYGLGIGDWGFGIWDRGLGIGDWVQLEEHLLQGRAIIWGTKECQI